MCRSRGDQKTTKLLTYSISPFKNEDKRNGINIVRYTNL